MLKDVRASELFLLLHQGESVAGVARRLNMSEKTVRKYRDSEQLPSQMERPPRSYRTREDPLREFWPEIETLLESDPRLKPYAILDWLKQKYNPADGPPRVTESVRRTLERRILNWKLRHGVQQEVRFSQVHHAGDLIAFDFVRMNELQVTIRGKPLDHLWFHAVFTYSNWEHIHLCRSESFEALSTGLQDALHLAGGVPRRVRSDSLSAAVNNLSNDREFASRYRDLLAHYGVEGHRINVRKPHENGDVESSHGHFKDALDQALRLRGSRDFESEQQYVAFARDLASRRNTVRQAPFREEYAAFRPLPRQRLDVVATVGVKIKSDSVVRVKHNTYSVSSKYIGLRMEVRVHQDHLELWYGDSCQERMPRQFGRDKETIDFRHVIDSLIRKPGAFLNYKYVHHMYPTTRFRMAYDQLSQRTTEASAVKQYLKLLHAAKHEGLEVVDDVLRLFLSEGKPIEASAVLARLADDQLVPAPTDVIVDAPDLSLFDSLLQHKEVYDEEEASPPTPATLQDAADSGLEAYDRHLAAAGTAEGTAATGHPRDVCGDGGPGGPRAMDSHPVPGGTGGQGVPVADPESHSATDAACEPGAGQDVGPIPVVSTAAARDAAIRDAAERGLSQPTGQCPDLRTPGFGQDHAPFGIGGTAGPAGTIGLLLDLPDAGSGAVAGQTGPPPRTPDQEALQVRSPDHRRPGICATEPRGDGGDVHATRREVRTGKRPAQLESAVFEVGTDLQGSHDNRGGHRSPGSPLGDHRAGEGFQLSARRGPANAAPPTTANRIGHWFQRLTESWFRVPSSCR